MLYVDDATTRNTQYTLPGMVLEPSDSPYSLVSNLQAMVPSASEIDRHRRIWTLPIKIEDDDVKFGGKTLSTWHEEQRRRLCGSYYDNKKGLRGSKG
jgi:hypothetical protein